MNRIDWFLLKRLGSRIALTVAVFFGLICLTESLDSGRFNFLSHTAGVWWAVLAIVVGAARWSIKALPLTVLVGTIVGLTDLSQRQELTVIKASGLSIWRVLRAPALGLIVASLVITLGAESVTTRINRSLNPSQPGASGALTSSGHFWLEQGRPGERYVISADRANAQKLLLDDVTVYFIDNASGERVIAPNATLTGRGWELSTATLLHAEAPIRVLGPTILQTSTSPADLRLKLRSTEDLTFFELGAALTQRLTDPELRAAAATRFLRLLTLPALLVGSLFIAFAFTAGYRRSGGYGVTVLYGIVLGFVVFVITELADRAGSAGVLEPALAAAGPAFVAIVIGVTVLLHKEDGRI